MAASNVRTVVLGLGNPVLSDDAVGLKVAERLRELLVERPVPGVSVLCSTRGGLELLDLLSGYARAVIVDALTLPEPDPGRVHKLDLTTFAGMARLVGSHDISLSQAFQLAERFGIPMPGEVIILGIEAGEVHEFSEELTPPVARVVDPLARQIHSLLSGMQGAVEGDDQNEGRG
jgi:hydrogenase maturation protease